MQKLRVGVLMGGKSLEKEVSFNTGRTVCDYVDTTRYNTVPIFQSGSQLYLLPWHFLHRGKTTDFEHRLPAEGTLIAWDDLQKHVDFIYIAQHSHYAEDGILQGFLEVLGIPYLGSGVLASALGMDKIAQKTFLHNAGIAVPRHITVEPHEIESYYAKASKDKHFAQHATTILEKLFTAGIVDNFVVKPYNEGSSIGISVVDKNNLEAALKKACYIEPGKKKRVLIEEKITGMEFTCIILTDYITGEFIPLPPTESVPLAGTTFFDYEQKYMPGRGIKRTPARCSAETITQIQQTCIHVMRALGFTTMCRIDGFVTTDNKIVIIDPNTFSGMAPSSYIFNQGAEVNMSPSRIVNHIIETELHHYGLLDAIINQEKLESPIMNNQKIRVAILLGGKSNEKETSLDSGRNVFYKLSPHKYEPIPVFVSSTLELFIITQSQLVRNSTKEIVELLHETQKIKWNDLPTIADFVFNALHGGEGENGSVQGALEMLGMPYNGSSVLASALCMDKYKANQLLAMHGFDVPRNMYITKDEWKTFLSQYSSLCARPEPVEGFLGALEDILQQVQNERLKNPSETSSSARPECPPKLHAKEDVSKGATEEKNNLTYPLIVKPHDDGCSVMVQKVTNNDELITAINAVLHEKNAVLIEECITGMELTVGVIGNDIPRALPPSQAVSLTGILSIEEKFLPGAGENQTPAPLPQSALKFVQCVMENVYKTVQCKGYVRIDCFYQNPECSPTKQERVVILEINTLPGLTPATCLFHQAAEIDLKPMDFIDTLITLGFEEHKQPAINATIKTVLIEL